MSHILSHKLTLINKTKPKKAKYVYSPHPDFVTLKEKRSYWHKEVTKHWIDGKHGLTGFQYFYLQEWVLKDNITQNPIRPLWREDDERIIFEPLEKCQKLMYDYMLLKRRECAWSSILSARAIWKLLIGGDVNIGYTSADLDRIMKFFTDKIEYGVLRLDLPQDIFRLQYKISNTKSDSKFVLWDEKAPESKKILDGWETLKNPKAFEGSRLGELHLDEIAIHGKIDEVMGSANASRMASQIRTAIMLLGGTAGTVTQKNKRVLAGLIESANSERRTVQYYLGYEGILFIPDDNSPGDIIKTTVNGYTNHTIVKEYIERERERLYKGGNMVNYWNYYFAYPLTPDEILQAKDESNLPEDIKQAISKQYQEINKNKRDGEKLFVQHRIDFGKAYPSNSGNIFLLREPNKDHFYGCGLDPIQYNSASKDGSDCVLSIKDFTDNQYVGFHISRTQDPDPICAEFISLQEMYNNAQVMAEMDAGATIYSIYKQWGRIDLFAKSPFNTGIKFTQTIDDRGYKSKAFLNKNAALLLNYFRNFCDLIWFERVFDEAVKWGTDANLDVLDSMGACELYHDSYRIKQNKSKKGDNTIIRIPTIINGKLVYKDVNIDKNYLKK